jgi:hypothetical protein
MNLNLGLFDLHTGVRIAEIKVENGLLYRNDLRTNSRSYISVIYKNKQMRVSDFRNTGTKFDIIFDDRSEIAVDATKLLLSFQDPEQRLEL